ncbi:aldo/keto reductase [bacterium]|nr:MAG: aldo/keto reductase [bacterium]
MRTRSLVGKNIGAIGLGCMGMSAWYGPTDLDESRRALDRAVELGTTHWDTADIYGNGGENERFLAEPYARHRDRVTLATKFGNVYDPALSSHRDLADAATERFVDGTPEYLAKALDASLKRLNVETIDLYYLHRVDPRTPIEDTVGAMADAVRAGKIRAIGLSECSAETLRRAHAVHPIAAVQSELSLWTRDYLHDVVPLCAELGSAFVAYSPLGRGFLTGTIRKADDLASDDWRRGVPRFSDAGLDADAALVQAVENVAHERDVTSAQVALAWVLAQGEHIIPIPGTKRAKYVEQNAAADDFTLTPEDLTQLESVATSDTDRYPADMMSRLNI